MIDTTADLLQTAIDHHRRGELQQAETAYRQLLSADPDQPDALHLWGVLAHQTGRVHAALEAMQRAETAHQNNAIFHFNFAKALADRGDIRQAIARYRRAISLKPDFIEAYQNLAALLLDQQRPGEALAVCQSAIERDSTNTEILLNYGLALEHTGAASEAMQIYQRLIAEDTRCVTAYLRLAERQQAENRLDLAINTLSNARQIFPDSPAVHNNLARLLQDAGRLDEAITSYHRALELVPDRFEILINLGTAYKERGDIDTAIRIYEQALEHRPDGVEAWHNLGVLYQDEGLLSAAEACFNTALHHAPQHAAARAHRALIWLQQERFEQGWPEYQWRLPIIGKQLSLLNGIPLWQGESLEGKTLFIAAEQGLGDQILFATCLRDWHTAPARIVLLCDSRLVPLLARTLGKTNTVILPDNPEGRQRVLELAEQIDIQIPLGSLPCYCRTTFESFAGTSRPLRAAPERIEHWRKRLRQISQSSQCSIGISWRGGASRKDRLHRSTSLEQWTALFTTPATSNVQWICLQHGDCTNELDKLQHQTGITVHRLPSIDPFVDLEEFAALIASLDLVISVDNTTVHLAGGLGIPTWVMLPDPATWYWFQQRHDCPWYASVRLFRQSRRGDWTGVFSRVAEALTAWLNGPNHSNMSL